ncbi:hypothetical protein SAMN04487948_102177 [Halogranum amylolyticum]|uniref:Uncharacterized protein n=1 Tax=Halogranum amylolyticum TaxID=660520 RepID=A0A1H8PA75_9EURY|nr:hypothetical protein SAMN04487948_102177 [Halogranum amylolyticum]
MYTIEWGERSRLAISVGHDLKEKYGLGYYERRPLWSVARLPKKRRLSRGVRFPLSRRSLA